MGELGQHRRSFWGFNFLFGLGFAGGLLLFWVEGGLLRHEEVIPRLLGLFLNDLLVALKCLGYFFLLRILLLPLRFFPSPRPLLLNLLPSPRNLNPNLASPEVSIIIFLLQHICSFPILEPYKGKPSAFATIAPCDLAICDLVDLAEMPYDFFLGEDLRHVLYDDPTHFIQYK